MKDIIKIDNMLNLKKNIEEKEILELNEITKDKGLYLSEKDVEDLIVNKAIILKENGRVEVRGTTIKNIIESFYDSSFIDKDNYLESIEELTNIFYKYQQEFYGVLSDEEILIYLKEEFDNIVMGSFTLLESDSLEKLKENVLCWTFLIKKV